MGGTVKEQEITAVNIYVMLFYDRIDCFGEPFESKNIAAT